MPNITAIIAMTNNTWIIPPTEYINTPNAHPMMSITAIIYNSEFMMLLFNGFHRCKYNIYE